MRTTIELPEEIFSRAQEQASRQGMDVNQFISMAVTKMVQASAPALPTASGRRVEFPVIKAKPGAPVITQGMVDRVEEQVLEEEAEAEYYARFMRR